MTDATQPTRVSIIRASGVGSNRSYKAETLMILGIAGRKQAGKSTLANYLEKNSSWLFPGKNVKMCGFADTLKDVCCELFAVPKEWAYGDDGAKKKPTNASWHGEQLSVRRLLQVFGTELVRSMWQDAWVHAALERAKKNQIDIPVFCDIRFPNEVDMIQKHGGKVIRLTRCPHPEDSHASETSLDEDRFDWKRFDFVLDNKNLTTWQQQEAFLDILEVWGLITLP